MALKELLGKMEKTLVLDGVSVKVRPLNLKDIGDLLDSHSEELKDLFNFSKGFKQILIEMPKLAYKVIHMSTGEEIEDISNLAVGYQLQLFEAVVDASQISSDAMGKLIGRLIKGVQTADLMPENSTLPIGKKLSKEQSESLREKVMAS